jgi:hypothetical protein
MTTIQMLLEALDERTIARKIGIPHDETRMAYGLRSNTAPDFRAFEAAIGDYFNYHFSATSHGGRLSRDEAIARAKEMLERAYQRRNGNLLSAYADAHEGLNGGLRHVLDILADGFKMEAIERLVRQTFDRYVAPNSWEDKVELLRQFFNQCGVNLSPLIRRDQPERYAHDYVTLIRAYANAIQQTSSSFRRL